MKRRTFLKLASLAGLTPKAAVAEVATDPDGARVIVVGGGPAGITAALELQSRGVDVLLLEAGGQLGGRVSGWTEELDGRPVDVEHGIHGWYGRYTAFTDLLERYGLDGALNEPERISARWVESGSTLDGNSRAGRRGLRAMLRAQAKALGYPRVVPQLAKGTQWLRGLTPSTARAALGGQSVEAAQAAGGPLTVWRLMTERVASGLFFSTPDRIDASEWALGEAFLGAGGDEVRWLRGNPQTLIWGPLAEAFTDRGGEIRLLSPVSEIVIEGGRAVGVRVGEPMPGVQTGELQQGWTVLPREGHPPVYVHRDAERVRALSGRCTHEGCPVLLDEDEQGFSCTCHGGRFDLDGVPVEGPPKEPLEPLFVDFGADGVHVEGEAPTEVLRADAIIVAVDAPALANMLGTLLPQTQGLGGVRETVARFWMDKQPAGDTPTSLMLMDEVQAVMALLVHRLQDDARAWAARTGGSVLEVQMAHVEEDHRESVLDGAEVVLRTAFPELEGATTLKRTLTLGSKYTAFPPNWFDAALPVKTPIDGLMVAGDHVLTDRVCAGMERAVHTGQQAANAVLLQRGLPGLT